MVLLDVKGGSVTNKGVVSLSLVVVVVIGDVVVVVGSCVELVLTKVVASGFCSVVSTARCYLYLYIYRTRRVGALFESFVFDSEEIC